MVQAQSFDEAITHFRKVLQANPDSAETRNNLGAALLQKGRLDEAITHFQKVLEVNPESAEVHNNLGRALAQKGRLDEAITHWQKALAVSPNCAEAHCSLGSAFYQRGRIAEALAHWRQGLRVEPDNLPVLNHTAWVLATCPEASVRNGAPAVELAERALHLSGGRKPAVLDTLAAACAEVGRFPEAPHTARQALALATQQNRQLLADALEARTTLYEARTPFRKSR